MGIDIDENQLSMCNLKDATKVQVDIKYALNYLLSKDELCERKNMDSTL